jgi:KaiC/GvpD/RAD55 family RecA-like ATPase
MAFESGITELPETAVIMIEEDPGVVKETFILKIAVDTTNKGKNVVYLTSRMRNDILVHSNTFHIPIPGQLNIVDSFRNISDLKQVEHGEFCVIDSFSTMFARSTVSELENVIEWLLVESRKGATFVILIDTGVLPAKEEQLLRSMCDGVIQFVSTTEGDRMRRYINVPKMRGIIPPDRMLPITISDEGILIDTRERHG